MHGGRFVGSRGRWRPVWLHAHSTRTPEVAEHAHQHACTPQKSSLSFTRLPHADMTTSRGILSTGAIVFQLNALNPTTRTRSQLSRRPSGRWRRARTQRAPHARTRARAPGWQMPPAHAPCSTPSRRHSAATTAPRRPPAQAFKFVKTSPNARTITGYPIAERRWGQRKGWMCRDNPVYCDVSADTVAKGFEMKTCIIGRNGQCA